MSKRAKITNAQYEIKHHPSTWSIAGCVEYDYEQYVPGCSNEDDDEDSYHRSCSICRCSVIQNAHVEKVYPLQLAQAFYSKATIIGQYFLEHYFTHINISTDHFTVDVSGGYYGEEIDGVEIDDDLRSRILEDLERCQYMTDTQLINECLIREYGYILPALEGLNWETRVIDPTKIIIGNEYYLRKLGLEGTQSNQYKCNREMPIGLYIEVDDGKYQLIDGYHRYIANVQNVKTKRKTQKPLTVTVLVAVNQ